MARSLYINLDATNLRSSSVRSEVDFRPALFTQLVAGDSIDLNLYAVNSSGLQNIQDYSSVRVAVGGSDSRPNAGSYTIDTSNTLNYNHSASELESIIDSAVADATVTELAPFVFKIQFTANGAQTIPTVDERLLSPRSTVDVARMVTGDSSTQETWLWRLYRNPLAFTDTFTNISGNGITGTLDLNTSGIYDLISNEESENTFFEIELTSSSGNITTVLQAGVTVLGEVIGQSFNGTVPLPSGMSSEANAFLQSFPNPQISGSIDIGKSVTAENLSIEKNVSNTISSSSDASAAVGKNNTVNNNHSLVVGKDNTSEGSNSLIVGIGNTGNQSGNYALGDRNEVGHPTVAVGGNSTAIGTDNVLRGGNSFVAGNDNSLTEAATDEFVSSSIIGNGNDISGSRRAFIVGQGNTIADADDSIVVGKDGVIGGNNSIALGTGLKDYSDNNTVILGRYNADPGADAKIVIGAGFSGTARYNAIEIESKGASMKARSKLIFRSLKDTNSYSSDSAAGTAGVEIGELYRDENTVKIRMS